MSKTWCELGDRKYQKKLPVDPKFTCKKCKRLANKKRKVCKPRKL